MPIYEYQCDACGKTFEAMQKFSDAPLSECAICGLSPVRKLISQTSFQLKGGGWYATDYKKTKPSETAKADSSPSPSKDKPKPSGGGTSGSAT